MFDQARGNLRNIGVRIPENQSTEQAPEMTIVGISDVEWKYMKWGDESGRMHEGLVFSATDKNGDPIVFYPPNTEAWFKSCKPFSKIIQDQFKQRSLERRSGGTSGAVPENDEVSIMQEVVE
jgi:hypothetical protein